MTAGDAGAPTGSTAFVASPLTTDKDARPRYGWEIDDCKEPREAEKPREEEASEEPEKPREEQASEEPEESGDENKEDDKDVSDEEQEEEGEAEDDADDEATADVDDMEQAIDWGGPDCGAAA